MKKEVMDNVQLQIKSLSKTYKNISRQNIRILHQFCQYDYRRTNKVVCMANEMKNPVQLIETIIKKPEISEELLADLERRYQKIHGPDVEAEKTEEKMEEEKQVQVIQKLQYNFFETVPNDCIMKVMEYLEPYSFCRFAFTSKNMFYIGKSEAQSEYYRNLCMKVFKFITLVLPAQCRFSIIKDYVLQRPNQFGPNTRNAVQNNLRRYIWKIDLNNFTLESGYYKSFGSYENLFKHCPRVNFNGYYCCRQKYIKIGERNQKYPIAPIHVIYYYRYFRFLEDGTVLYHVRSKRLKVGQIMKFLSKALVQEQDQNYETMIGQYIHFKDTVLVKAVRNNTVFTYELSIRSSEGKISNELKINKYTLELIDDHQEILQNLYIAKPFSEDKLFQYCYNAELAEENSAIIQATSL